MSPALTRLTSLKSTLSAPFSTTMVSAPSFLNSCAVSQIIMHSRDEDVVPYENATRAKNKWKGANIQYSLGHFGGHVATCMRFIYTVQTLLINDEAEEDGNYDF